MSTITVTTRNDILWDALSDEAAAMLEDGATLDHIFTILPSAVSIKKFEALLSHRVQSWALKYMTPPPPGTQQQSMSIPEEAWWRVRMPFAKFWDTEAYGEHLAAIGRGAYTIDLYNDFQSSLESDLRASVINSNLFSGRIDELVTTVPCLVRLCPHFDGEAWVVKRRGYLIDMWNALC